MSATVQTREGMWGVSKKASGLGHQLGQWVAQRRQHLSMTQQQVWERMDPAPPTSNWVSKLESGRIGNLPDFDLLNALSEALRVPVTEVLRGAGVLPEGVEQPPQMAPGTATIHALVDMIDWTENPANRENVEGLLRLILDRQSPNRQRPRPAGVGDHSAL